MAVAVASLVHGGNVAQVGRRAVTGDSALAHSGESWRVVREIGQGGIRDVMRCGHQARLGYEARLLQVAISDSAIRAVRGDKVRLDVGREREPPDVALPRVIEVDSSHAGLGSVGCSKEGWILRDYLGEVGRSVAEVSGQGGEGVDVMTQT